MRHISLEEIKSWERFYRANFVNSLTGYKSVSLIGTSDALGRFNLAIFSSIVHLGSDPALVGYINRPRAAAPHTLANIEATGIYTINHIHPAMLNQAHQTSAKYEEGESEFEATGLEALVRENCAAPFVKASRLQYSLRLEEIVPIRQNETYLVIGAVQDVYLQQTGLEPGAGLLQEDGFLALEQIASCASLGADGYYLPTPLKRIPYAKVPQKVDGQ
jgi:flavin reductase (DIM6/NTAB) family NADH-FMN oxidoreductase RutF